MAKKNIKKQVHEENEMLKFIKVIIVVTIIFGLFYALTSFINKEDVEEPAADNNTSQTIQYDEILIGNIFSKKGNYYVLVEGVDDKNTQVYEAYLSVYSQKEDSKRVYISKLDDMFNSKYIKEETNLSEDLSKLSFNSTVLLEIENGKIKKSYKTDEEIRTLIKELAKEETINK